MRTVSIPIPEGYEVDSFDKSTGEIKLREKPKDIKERIETVDDVLSDNGYTHERFDKLCESLSEDEKAFRILKLLAVSLNEGWQPDWNDSNQPKYFPWFEMGGSSGFRFDVFVGWDSCSSVGSRLCFKSRELCKYAGEQFTDIYKKFML